MKAASHTTSHAPTLAAPPTALRRDLTQHAGRGGQRTRPRAPLAALHGPAATLLGAAILLAALLPAAAADAQGRVKFFAESQVTGPRLTLDDVARIEGVDEALKARLRAIDLGAAPRPMGSRSLSRPTIEAALRQAGLPEGLNVVFPRQMIVQRPGQKLPEAEAGAMARAAITEALSARWGQGYAVAVDLTWRGEVLLPQGAVVVAAEIDGAKPQGASLVRVRFEVGGVQEETRQVSARITVEGPGCKAARDLERGAPIGPDDVVEARGAIERDAIPCAEALGMAPRSLIREGAALRLGALEAPALVKRGDRVTVTFQAGGLRITTQGEAMRDGALGERIPVNTVASAKVINAEVGGPGEVWVR